jgi:hypothetical protein
MSNFCTEVFFKAFICLQFEFVTFWHKEISAKTAGEMLVKMTPVVNFTNILPNAFMREDLKSVKNTVKPSGFFVLLGFACIKAAHKMLVKSTSVVNFTNILQAAFMLTDHKSAKRHS